MNLLWPTADDVAYATIAAAREVGIDPLLIASPGDKGRVRQARVYAALALRRAFNTPSTPGGPGNTNFSRMVGGHRNLLTIFDNDTKYGVAHWFDEKLLERVYLCVKHSVLPKLVPKPEPIPLTPVVRTVQKEPPPPKVRTKPIHRTRLVDSIPFRQKPAVAYADNTAAHLGDPAPERSALAEYVARELERQRKAQEERERYGV